MFFKMDLLLKIKRDICALQHDTPLKNVAAASALIQRELHILRSTKFLKRLYQEDNSTPESDWLPYIGAIPDGKEEAAALLSNVEFLEIFSTDYSIKSKIHDSIQSHFLIHFPNPGYDVRITIQWYTEGRSNHSCQIFMDTKNLDVPRDYLTLDSPYQYKAKCRRWGMVDKDVGEDGKPMPKTTQPIITLRNGDDENEDDADDAPGPGCYIIFEGLKRLHEHFRSGGVSPFVGLLEFLAMVGLAHNPNSIPEMLIFLEKINAKQFESELLQNPNAAPPKATTQSMFDLKQFERVYHQKVPTFDDITVLRPHLRSAASSSQMDLLHMLPDDLVWEIIRKMSPVTTALRLRCLSKQYLSRLPIAMYDEEQRKENENMCKKHQSIVSNPMGRVRSCLDVLACRILRAEIISVETALEVLLMELTSLEMHLLFDSKLQELLNQPKPAKIKIPDSFKDAASVALIDVSHDNRVDGAAYWMNSASLIALQLPGKSTLFVKFFFRIQGYRGHEKTISRIEYVLNDPSHFMLELSEPQAELRSFIFDQTNLELSTEVEFLHGKCKMWDYIQFYSTESSRDDSDLDNDFDEEDEDEAAEIERYRTKRIISMSEEELKLQELSLYPAQAVRSPQTDHNRPHVLLDTVIGVRLEEEKILLEILKDHGIDGFEASRKRTGGGITLPGSIEITPHGISAFIIRLGLCEDPSFRCYFE